MLRWADYTCVLLTVQQYTEIYRVLYTTREFYRYKGNAKWLPKRSHSPFVIKLLISPPDSSCNWTSSWKWKMEKIINYVFMLAGSMFRWENLQSELKNNSSQLPRYKALVILLKNINLFPFVFALIKSQRQMVSTCSQNKMISLVDEK